MKITHLINWHDEYRWHPNRWLNHGRRVAEYSCKHKTQVKDSNADNRETNMLYSGWCERCGFSEDSCEPMMNYGYPLYGKPDDNKILQIVKRTCLTVMENSGTEEYFLALCGGGMDLSQSLAYAYILAGHRIPYELVFQVSTQPCLSVGEKEYIEIMGRCKRELQDIQQRASAKMVQIENAINS